VAVVDGAAWRDIPCRVSFVHTTPSRVEYSAEVLLLLLLLQGVTPRSRPWPDAPASSFIHENC